MQTQDQEGLSVLDRALIEYRVHKLNVFPLVEGTKNPLVRWEKAFDLIHKRATEDQVISWFTEWPNANVGIVCGPTSDGVCFEDIEHKADSAILHSDFASLEEKTRIVETAHRGVQIGWKAAEQATRHTKIFDAAHPVDFLGLNGYTLAPGSVINHALCSRSKEDCPHIGFSTYRLVSQTDVFASASENVYSRLLETGKSLGWLSKKKIAEKEQLPGGQNFDSLFEKALKRDKKLSDLYSGQWQAYGYKTRSEAEMALACKLVWYGFADSQIFQIMSECQIGKWQEKQESYRELTISKARRVVALSRIDNKQRSRAEDRKSPNYRLEFVDGI